MAGAAFLPYALWVLVAANFFSAVGTLVLCLLGTVVPLALLDRLFYGRWTVREPWGVWSGCEGVVYEL